MLAVSGAGVRMSGRVWSAGRSVPGFGRRISGMPRPRGLPVVGTALSFIAAGSGSRLHWYIDSRHAELGPVFHDSVGPVTAVFVSEPQAMRHTLMTLEGRTPAHALPEPWLLYNQRYNKRRGLFFMDGEEWLQTRRLMNAVMLRPAALPALQAPIRAVADLLISSWRTQCDKSPTHSYQPDLEKQLYRLSLDVMLSVMLGSAYFSAHQRFDELLSQFAEQVHHIMLYSARMTLLPASYYANLRTPAWRGFVKAVTESLLMGEQMVEKIYSLEDMGDGLVSKMLSEGMEKALITSVLTDLIIAAGDTTAFTTQWALYSIAKNQYVVDEYSSLSEEEEKQSYLRAVIKETLRLYPAAPFITRFLPADGELAGYQIPAGTLVVLSVFTACRQEENFEQALEFLPSRWRPRGVPPAPLRPPCALAALPFAVGARSCIGRHIANSQMQHTLQQILENFHLKLLNKEPVEVKMQMILKPRQEVQILVTPK